MIEKLKNVARASYRASGLALLTLVQLGAVETHQRLSSPEKRDAVFDRHMRVWVRTLLRVFGVQLVMQPEHIPPRKKNSRLIVSNHRSPIDIAIVLSTFGGQVLSRADIATWPILGTAARKAGTIFVDRDESASGAQAIRQIRRRLKEGATISVFPEGTTFEGDTVRPFRMGAFVGIRGLDLEIVPVGIAYQANAEFVDETFLRHLRRSAERPVTRVAVCVGDPIVPDGRAAEIGKELEIKVQELVNRARQMLDSNPTK
ncbi:MAG: 1-acyl-sn-glycerol-3-phosphate acyltransferase [Polyangiaceae bacterium]|nr:1-acyl-sn-glycerol-3-phosphate acyltransferase [Polyangiaceae bacterium]